MIVDQLTSRHICSQLTSVSTDALPNLPLLWIVMDLESTGLNLARDRITQIAAFAYLTGMNEFVDSSEFHCYAICCGSFSCFVCPQVPVEGDAARISGLTTASLAGQPTFDVQGARLLEWLLSLRAAYPDVQPILVAHNGLRCYAFTWISIGISNFDASSMFKLHTIYAKAIAALMHGTLLPDSTSHCCDGSWLDTAWARRAN